MDKNLEPKDDPKGEPQGQPKGEPTKTGKPVDSKPVPQTYRGSAADRK